MLEEKKEDLRVKRTRKLLYQALFSLMDRHSFKSISVKEICEEAMVHRATFYTHFNDKYDLLTYSLNQIADELDFKESTVEESHVKLFTVAVKYKRLFSQVLLEERDSLRFVIRKEMTTGMKQQLFSENKTKKISTATEIAIEAYAGATLGVLNWWIENDTKLNAEEIYNEIKQVLNWKHIENSQDGFDGKE